MKKASDRFLIDVILFNVRTIHVIFESRMQIPFDLWALAYTGLDIAKKEGLMSESSIGRLTYFLDSRRGRVYDD